MSRTKDNSSVYALILTVLILFVIVGFKYKNRENFNFFESEEIVASGNAVTEQEVDTVKFAEVRPTVLEYEGKYATQSSFFEDSQISERLRSLIGPVRMHQIKLHWNIEDPVQVNGNMLSASGCQEDNCENTSFLILIDAMNNVFYAGIKIEGNVELFSENGIMTKSLQDWKLQNESATIIREEEFNAIENYFQDMSTGNFDARKYFAEEVLRYINLSNTTPAEINRSYQEDLQEFKNQEFIYDKATFEKDRTVEGISYYSFLLKYKAYRTSKRHYEESEIRTEIGIDATGRIASLAYPKIESSVSY